MRGRFLRTMLCAVALLAVPVMLALFAFALPAQYTETFLGGFANKLDVLHSTQGPRIILAGGSGTAFAVRSDLLEQELPGYRVVNLGMYAGLGSTVPLDAVKDELRKDDIVIFLPEQSEQTLSMYFGSEYMWQAADGHWSLLHAVHPDNIRAMLGQLPYFAAQKARYFFDGNPPQGDGIYARSSFNAWGDIESDLRDANHMPDQFDHNVAVSFADDLPSQDFISYVNDYAGMCESKGAAFYFGFCPINKAAMTDVSADAIAAYEQRLSAQLTCPVLGSVYESVMDAEWFYDTNFHLNAAGAVVYTATLARQIKQAFGLPEDISIELPQKPGTVAHEAYHGDDTDAAFFLYSEADHGLMIVGLTEDGAAAKVLILPTHYNDKPVVGLDAATFAGNTTIETITLQANLRTIPNSAFDGCTSLQQIVIDNVAPSECTVGGDLLCGTNAFIYVDAEMLAAYQTNYFWAVHADRIRAIKQTDAAVVNTPDADVSLVSKIDGPYIRYIIGDTMQDVPFNETHLRQNTLTNVDVPAGYQLIAWNTEADGSGLSVSPGSRINAASGMTLYAQLAAESPEEAFDWITNDNTVTVIGYHGSGDTCVVPAEINTLPVHCIASGAFDHVDVSTIILPNTLRVIEPDAFKGCTLNTLYLCDTLETVSDSSFEHCTNLATLHIIAASSPVYSTSYYATFADKHDWLLSLAGQKKLVLFSGSSTRYGYDSEVLHRAYPAYQVANMGVYAYTNALPQMELILPLMDADDVLLHAPEFDCLNFQTCENNKLDFHFWAMMEANYDCVSVLDLRQYSQVFDSLQKYLTIRRDLPGLTYAHTPNGFDDDGNDHRSPTYNKYGDFTMLRQGNKIDIMLKYVRSDYTTDTFTEDRIAYLNSEYQRFLDKGIRVLFTYTPRNRSSITEESTKEKRAELDRTLRDKLCVPVISRIENSLISGEYFFLIDSHLSTEGVRLHTQQIVDDLKPWMD